MEVITALHVICCAMKEDTWCCPSVGACLFNENWEQVTICGLSYNVELKAYSQGATYIIAWWMTFTLTQCVAMTLSLTDLMNINEPAVNKTPWHNQCVAGNTLTFGVRDHTSDRLPLFVMRESRSSFPRKTCVQDPEKVTRGSVPWYVCGVRYLIR